MAKNSHPAPDDKSDKSPASPSKPEPTADEKPPTALELFVAHARRVTKRLRAGDVGTPGETGETQEVPFAPGARFNLHVEERKEPRTGVILTRQPGVTVDAFVQAHPHAPDTLEVRVYSFLDAATYADVMSVIGDSPVEVLPGVPLSRMSAI